MQNERKILKAVTERYGSVNGCWDRMGKYLGMSRTNFYALMAYKTPNPGIDAMKNISVMTGLSLEETINDYIAGHRDIWPRN